MSTFKFNGPIIRESINASDDGVDVVTYSTEINPEISLNASNLMVGHLGDTIIKYNRYLCKRC